MGVWYHHPRPTESPECCVSKLNTEVFIKIIFTNERPTNIDYSSVVYADYTSFKIQCVYFETQPNLKTH